MVKGIGILGWGTYIPNTFMDKEQLAAATGIPADIISAKLGLERKPIPGPHDHCSTMAVKAARRALARADTAAEDLDLVIWTGDEYKDYPLWTAAIKIKEELGAKNAWAFDISLRCGTMILGLKLARDMITADPHIKKVLLAGGYRNGDLIDYKNPRVRFMYSLGAGASAVVLGEDEKNNILGTAFTDDGTLTHTVVVPAGGTKEPLSPDGVKRGRHRLEVTDPLWMKEHLAAVSMDKFFWVIDTALDRSGLTREDIDYLAMLHMKPSAYTHILAMLGLRPEQSIYLREYGHLGQNDQILSLELALKEGLVSEGSTVVMVSAGIGYAWNAAVVRWGQKREDLDGVP